MKKYKLAKDLPFAKAGMKLEKRHNDELGVYFWYVYNDNSDEWWQIGCDLTIDHSWIEEVKPREWHVVVNKFNNVIGYGNVDKRVTEQYRLQNHSDRLDDFEIVHVQEID